MSQHSDVQRRHEFVLLFDVTDGNPNGDPDAGNLPRVDPETMHGLVTDVCMKRKVRNWVDATRGGEAAFKIYVQNCDALNTLHDRAYKELGLPSKGKSQPRDEIEKVRRYMCGNFYDIRLFGAVMTTGKSWCGQVRGPVQLTFARSVDPIQPLDLAITRIAITDEAEFKSGKQTEMGRKAIVPYGLYRAHGFFNPHFAKRTGVSAEDMDLFWQALQSMWDLDRSAARGQIACRGLYVFSHESSLGNAPAHVLLDRVRVQRAAGVVAPRSFGDYLVSVDGDSLPVGVTLTTLVS